MNCNNYDSCFEAFLGKVRNISDPDKWKEICETKLPLFIIKYADSNFPGIYERTDRAFYDGVRSRIATNPEMRAEDQQVGQIYSRALKLYSEFLQSKYFPKPILPMEQVDGYKKKNKKRELTNNQKTLYEEPTLSEGGKIHIEQERNYRNPALRQACLEYWGTQCQCCGMDFEKVYGESLGSGYIEVHHLRPVSSYEDEHQVNPVEDLVPLCANCHAMIHRGKNGLLTLAELREAYQGYVWKIEKKKEG